MVLWAGQDAQVQVGEDDTRTPGRWWRRHLPAYQESPRPRRRTPVPGHVLRPEDLDSESARPLCRASAVGASPWSAGGGTVACGRARPARSRLSTDQRQQPCTDSVGHSVRGRGKCHCDVRPGVPPPWPGCGQPRAEAIGAVLQPHTYEQHTAPVVVHGHRLSRRQSTIIGARHGTVTASSVARISTGHRGGPRVPSPCR
jgi:hypothetical protein